MFEQQRQLLRHTLFVTLASSLFWNTSALAKDPIEAAQDLANSGAADPNGLTLMIVCICMLFVFALTIIIATTVQTFKGKPSRARTPQIIHKEVSRVG